MKQIVCILFLAAVSRAAILPQGTMVEVRLRAELDSRTARTGDLVVERRVGRGRIVVTAFSLSAPDVVNWGSFDSFSNNGLLRRPRRVFTAGQYGSVSRSPAVSVRTYAHRSTVKVQ